MQWLSFSADWRSVGQALAAGALIMIGVIVAAFLTAGIANAVGPTSFENRPPFDHISSVTVSNDYAGIRLAGRTLECTTMSPDNIQCEGLINGQTLMADITHGEHNTACAATYGGEMLPNCFASFSNTRPFDYYVVVRDDLGLPQEQFASIAQETRGAGWGERDWVTLALIISLVLGIAAALAAWLHSSQHARQKMVLRLVYTAGLGIMVTGALFFAAQPLLLAFQFID